MTFSIVARQGPAFGVAVASKFLAVGAVVPAAVNGVGAVATQASARVAYLDELIGALRSGGIARDDGESAYAIQGNILTGPEVVAAMESAWHGSAGRPFAQRLLAALVAGDDAGGDSRGRQSAAMYAVEPGAGYDACGVLAAEEVRGLLAGAGYPADDLPAALADWAGHVNYETRLSPDGIDARVLEALRATRA